MSNSKPQLPLGNASFFKGISENFSFHASPESFITSRVLEFQAANPDAVKSRAVVRAKVLNRNVAIVSSYEQIRHVLSASAEDGESDPPYVAGPAYEDLMAPFFPLPNLLLADGSSHCSLRNSWEQLMAPAIKDLSPFIEKTIMGHFQALLLGSTEVDLYETVKRMSWKILLGAFLNIRPEDTEFTAYQHLHEVLLRGQFSLMPVSINAGIWSSPRQKGKDAKSKLQSMINERLRSSTSSCPFKLQPDAGLENVANHTLLFTSSLAVKGLASLLTAFLLNLYLFPYKDRSIMNMIAGFTEEETRQGWLESVLVETERLSPPIVGVMRRSSVENVIPSPAGHPDVLIPKGWDIWLYFVGGGRDPSTFGDTWDRFIPERHLHAPERAGFAFGSGSKSCLGKDLVREIAITCAKVCMKVRINLQGEVLAKGVRGWLGWDGDDSVSPQDWAAEMKQLPTQRPANPILVRFIRDG